MTVRGYHLPFGVTIYRLGLPFTVRRYHLPPGETPSKWERPVTFQKHNLGWGGVGTRRPEADIGVGWGGVLVAHFCF